METRGRIGIIGAGIGGTAAALSLARAGYEVTLFEARSEQALGQGLFLNLARNGLDIMQSVGLLDEAITAGIVCPDIQFVNHDGRYLGSIPNGPLNASLRNVAIRRADLSRILIDAAADAGVQIRFQSPVDEVNEGPASARLRTGSKFCEFDSILIADGVNSRFRQLVDPNSRPPEDTGVVSLGGYSNTPNRPDAGLTIRFGRLATFGTISHDGVTWWFSNPSSHNVPRHADSDALQDWLFAVHESDGPEVRSVLEANTTLLRAFPIHDVRSVTKWHTDRLCLLGDAAHATSPHSGQGASMALEDAWELSKAIQANGLNGGAFAQYQATREGRTRRVVAYSRTIGKRKLPRTGFGRWMRDRIMQALTKNAHKRDPHDWLYEGVSYGS